MINGTNIVWNFSECLHEIQMIYDDNLFGLIFKLGDFLIAIYSGIFHRKFKTIRARNMKDVFFIRDEISNRLVSGRMFYETNFRILLPKRDHDTN